MNIGQVAKRVDLPTSTIRYYESIGILPEPSRKNGRRIYDEAIIERLQTIQVAKKAGFTLDEIAELFNSHALGGHFSEKWKSIAQGKLAELDELIARAEVMQQFIHQGLACDCTSMSECNVIHR